MSLTIPLNPRELEPFLITSLNDITLEPLKIKRLLQILRKMGEVSAEKKAILSKFPLFEITPNALSQEDLNILIAFTDNKPENTPYGRQRLWTFKFDAIVKGITITRLPIKPLDAVTKLFFDALRSFNEFKEGKWKFSAYIDRNEILKENAEKSGLSWHRDRFEDNSPPTDYAHYTLFLLLSDHTLWKSGELGVQLGGEKATDGSWVNSKNPEVRLMPRFNQAIVIKNLDSAHYVAPIIPTISLIKREVFILTACYVSK